MPLKRQLPGELLLTQSARVDIQFLEAVLTHVSVEGVLVSKLGPTV